MELAIVAGSGNPPLADAIADRLGSKVCRSTISRFPDTELHIEIHDTVRGCDVYLIQPTGPPTDAHLMELLFLADAGRRAGAARVTGIVPYLGYARQDRRAKGREAVGARVSADLLGTANLARMVAVDLHTVSLEGFFSMPLEHLSAVSLLANTLGELIEENSVIVAPDLGAVKLAENYAEVLQRPLAIVHKIRLSGEEVKAQSIVGEVVGRAPVIVDDMISTGGTIEAAATALLAAGCLPKIVVVATHALMVGPANRRLLALPLKKIVVTDSLPLPGNSSRLLQTVSLAPMLAETIARLNIGESIAEFVGHR
jgi:ribose-phosphate pyrophosphokinase